MVRKDGDRFVLEFQASGVRIFRRLPRGSTKKQAEAWEAKLRTDIFNHKKLGQRADLSLSGAIQKWLEATLRHKKDQRMPVQNARQLEPFVRGKTIQQAPEAAADAVRAWSGVRAKNGGAAACIALSPATINRRLAVLKATCKYAWRQGWVDQNLSGRISAIPGERNREVYLSRAQVQHLGTCCSNPKAKAAIMLAAFTGLRASELLAVSTKDILRRDALSVATSKNGKPRIVPVPAPALPYLSALPLAVSYRTLVGWFWEARAKAGMEHVHFHDLRHTCASWLINAGVDLYTVGKILGHSTPLTTARYAHLAQESLQKAMEKLD